MMRIATLLAAAAASFFLAACGSETTGATNSGSSNLPTTTTKVFDMNDPAQVTAANTGIVEHCSPLDRTKYADAMECHAEYNESLGTMKFVGYVEKMQPVQVIDNHVEFWVANGTTFTEGTLPVACPMSIKACHSVQPGDNVELTMKAQDVVQTAYGQTMTRSHYVIQSITVN